VKESLIGESLQVAVHERAILLEVEVGEVVERDRAEPADLLEGPEVAVGDEATPFVSQAAAPFFRRVSEKGGKESRAGCDGKLEKTDARDWGTGRQQIRSYAAGAWYWLQVAIVRMRGSIRGHSVRRSTRSS